MKLLLILLPSLILIAWNPTTFANPSCPELKPNMLNVHLVCHTHDDVGWLKTVDQYYYGSNKAITSVGVQYILDSVTTSLLADPNKKFIYVESAFFYRWWEEQTDERKEQFKSLVNNGQLEFINGGWCMNDEAAAHYSAIIDQMTIGLAKLNETFGAAAFPRIGWQIDPFGHSNEMGSIFAQMGMDAVFFGRLDHEDKVLRRTRKEMEMIWKPSRSLGEDSWILAGALPSDGSGYGPPEGFCFDLQCGDEPIMDDERLEDYNKNRRVDEFILAARAEALEYLSPNNIMMTMGEDFHYVYADSWYKNLDKLIKYVNALQSNGSDVNLVYSTPSCYLDAIRNDNLTFPTKEDDFFPYASDRHTYWTGYFTSRPTLKGFIAQSNNLLQAVKQLSALVGNPRGPSVNTLSEAMGVLQHHDAVTGTAKQHVTDDYSRHLSEGTAAAAGALNDGFRYLTNQAEGSQDEFTYCPLLNISSCSYLDDKTSFVVNVYNPIGRSKNFYVRVPVSNSLGYTVTDQDGNVLDSQLIPLPDQVVNIPGRTSSALYDLVFYAEDVPALGAEQFLIQSDGVETDVESLDLKFISPDEDFIAESQKFMLTFDAETKKLKKIGLKYEDELKDINVSQNWLWYPGMPGNNQEPRDRASGAYIFRPDGDPVDVSEIVNITAEYNGTLVHEIQQEWSPWLSQIIRTYAKEDYVEIEWLVGPIPVDDDVGKEVVNWLQFPDMQTNQTFYTDANGRELQKRIKDYRETWTLSLATENVSRNYYPVTSTILLKSVNEAGSAAVLNDRAQGGASLSEGQLELMVHRRLLHDDAKGVGEALNEVAFGEGLVARGRHVILHSDFATDDCDFGCQYRTRAEELFLRPILTFSDPSTFNPRTNGTSKKSGLTAPLPSNLRLLTLEPWEPQGTWLLRIENFYQVDESSQSQTIDFDIGDLFTDWTITNIQELTLGANAFKDEIERIKWGESLKNDEKKSSKRVESGTDASAIFSFTPMQIRTFLIQVANK
ncbi:UNVERIFIED_CONTAM: hypothetical protein RMT77_006688 [Armadillidium vulgare]